MSVARPSRAPTNGGCCTGGGVETGDRPRSMRHAMHRSPASASRMTRRRESPLVDGDASSIWHRLIFDRSKTETADGSVRDKLNGGYSYSCSLPLQKKKRGGEQGRGSARFFAIAMELDRNDRRACFPPVLLGIVFIARGRIICEASARPRWRDAADNDAAEKSEA